MILFKCRIFFPFYIYSMRLEIIQLYNLINLIIKLFNLFLVDPNSGTIHQHIINEPSQQQSGTPHQQSTGTSSLSSSHCIHCHSPLTPSNLRRDGGTLAMCDTCANYAKMNGIRGGPPGTSPLVGVRSSGSNRRVSASVRHSFTHKRTHTHLYIYIYIYIYNVVLQIYIFNKFIFSISGAECQ